MQAGGEFERRVGGSESQEVCMIGGKEAPNGFQWRINCGQKSLVSIKSPCIIKVLAAGNRYKLHLSPMSWGSLFN